jgi:hypothetical protein
VDEEQQEEARRERIFTTTISTMILNATTSPKTIATKATTANDASI